jgi:hypothetical protein
MWKLVSQYQLSWRLKDNLGVVYLRFEDGTLESLEPGSLQELAALGDILRNEKPVYYHTASGDLITGWEPTGEEEDSAPP